MELDHAKKDILYHKAIATEYDAVVVSPRRIINDAIFSACIEYITPGAVMLDLGCGTGHATLRFGHLFKSVVAVDHSTAMLEEARRNFTSAGIKNVETINQDVLTFVHGRAKRSADAISCIGFLHHLTEIEIAVVISEAGRILNPGGCLLVSEPRRIDANSTPQEIAEWNARSLAARIGYSHPVETIPEEGPIDEEQLLAVMRKCNIMMDQRFCHWEIFPHTIRVPEEESGHILDLHRRYGSSGNCVTIIAHKERSRFETIAKHLRSFY